MNQVDEVLQVARQIADAIARRDADALAATLAPGFRHYTPGGENRDAAAFLAGVRAIPGEIVFVRLEGVTADVSEGGALVTGVQRAQVRLEGKAVDDARAFVDWFVRHQDAWRLRAAVDLPLVQETQ